MYSFSFFSEVLVQCKTTRSKYLDDNVRLECDGFLLNISSNSWRGLSLGCKHCVHIVGTRVCFVFFFFLPSRLEHELQVRWMANMRKFA